MFYIKEFYFRCQYFIISFLLSAFICHFYKNILVLTICCSLINYYSIFYASFSKFIYNHPTELLKIQILTAFLIILFFLLHYVIWSLLDFVKSCLRKTEYKKLCVLTSLGLFLCSFLNLLCFVFLFPYIWFFFQNLNTFKYSESSSLIIFFELRIQDYFYFVFDFFYLINLLVFIFLLFYLFIFSFGITSLISWKKLFIFVNILFATFLSPPDVYSQIIVFLSLSFISEFIAVLYLYLFKLKKYY